ncbi:MAG: 16S rRNA (adenine(1518)-N(6)/adenine(1519)-N(6))-dimethyltransferase, partial [Acidobacteriota bacterium]|nr:16S rRNA (adenine(1518)-N(6)/adenine(1519)-N(6))-dimethyltransferase [Acidobacteriota bacterium]
MRAKKRYGQHFLLPQWADKLVDAIEPRADDRFLEIGPGPGVLTLRLAPRVAHLTAVEVDQEMVDLLTPSLPANVTLVHRDFLETPVGWPADGSDGPIRVVGNLPYNVSSPILFRLIESHKRYGRLTDAMLMLQREVAERIEAGPGSKVY